MARVFMSFLGTNRYVEAHYRLGDKCSHATPFVQEALVSLLCKDWSANDRLVFFLTEAARRANWEDGGNFSVGLKSRLEKLDLAPEIVSVPFTEGSSETEIMENFLKVVDHLREEDEVIFDITHSFRSLPMLNLVALNYGRVLRDIRIKGIYYGAFEVLGPPKEVERRPVEERLAPVFDLTPYALLLDWSLAAEEFFRYGLAERLVELVQERIKPILRETRGQDERAYALRGMILSLRDLTMNIYTCRCANIENTQFKEFPIGQSDLSALLPPFAPLLDLILKKVAPFFSKNSWEKAKAAVEWCLEHNLIQQGYTILEEAVISEVCRLAGYKILSEQDRSFISGLLNVTARKTSPEKWRGEVGRRKDEALRLQTEWGEPLRELARAFNQLANCRNDINHCGCRADSKKPGALKDALHAHYDAVCRAMRLLRGV